jgi:hypothetical protein
MIVNSNQRCKKKENGSWQMQPSVPFTSRRSAGPNLPQSMIIVMLSRKSRQAVLVESPLHGFCEFAQND